MCRSALQEETRSRRAQFLCLRLHVAQGGGPLLNFVVTKRGWYRGRPRQSAWRKWAFSDVERSPCRRGPRRRSSSSASDVGRLWCRRQPRDPMEPRTIAASSIIKAIRSRPCKSNSRNGGTAEVVRQEPSPVHQPRRHFVPKCEQVTSRPSGSNNRAARRERDSGRTEYRLTETRCDTCKMVARCRRIGQARCVLVADQQSGTLQSSTRSRFPPDPARAAVHTEAKSPRSSETPRERFVARPIVGISRIIDFEGQPEAEQIGQRDARSGDMTSTSARGLAMPKDSTPELRNCLQPAGSGARSCRNMGPV